MQGYSLEELSRPRSRSNKGPRLEQPIFVQRAAQQSGVRRKNREGGGVEGRGSPGARPQEGFGFSSEQDGGQLETALSTMLKLTVLKQVMALAVVLRTVFLHMTSDSLVKNV